MTVPNQTSFLKVAETLKNMMPELSKAADAALEAKKVAKEAAKLTKEYKELSKGLIDVKNSTKAVATQIRENAKLAKDLKANIGRVKKTAEVAKSITDKLKAGAFKQINPALGRWLGLGTALFSAGLTVMSIKVNEQVQDVNIEGDRLVSINLQQIISRLSANTFKLRDIEKIIKSYKDAVDRNYAEAASATKNATYAREKANEALYEVRVGRTKLEAGITEAKKIANNALAEFRGTYKKIETAIVDAKKQANDALYESRTGRTKLEAQAQANFNQNKQAIESSNKQYQSKFEQLQNQFKKFAENSSKGFEKQIETTVADIKKGLQETKIKNDNNENKITKIIPQISDVTKKITEIPQLIANIINPLSIKIDKNIIDLGDLRINFEKLAKQTTSEIAQVKKEQIKIDSELGHQGKSFEQSAKDFQNEVSTINQKFKETQKITLQRTTTIEATEQDVNKLKKELDQTKTDIEKLKIGVGEQDKLNKEGNSKLDRMLPLIGLIPAIPRDVANNIKPSIPTIPQIEQAATTGVCRSTQPGGCMDKALGNTANGINANTNSNANNILDGINAGANLEQLRLLNQIDGKLGAQLPGGIGGKLSRFTEWLKLDRVLNLLILASTIHNALMLSNDIGQTLLGAISNILQSIGLKGEDGQSFDLGSVISSTIENLIKGIVGTENYVTLKTSWEKAVRVYQATANVLNSFQNISNTILSGMELIGSYTGKIGNALKKSGEVLDSAYGWMHPQPRFNRITQGLQNLQQGASTIQQVTQVPLDVVNAVTELQTANTEFVKAIKEDNKPENKAPDIPEPDKLKADELASKVNSRIANILSDDLFNNTD